MINSIKELFTELNNNSNYLILRNWENIFDQDIYVNGHEDIDILCENKNDIQKLIGAKRMHFNKHRDNYLVPVGNLNVRFDIRWLGDGYYPEEWEKQMLKRRVFINPGVFVMCNEDYCFSLAYHALIQKAIFSEEYRLKIENSFSKLVGEPRGFSKEEICSQLDSFLNNNSYKIVIPEDPGVYMNWASAKKFSYYFSNRLRFRRFVYNIKGYLNI